MLTINVNVDTSELLLRLQNGEKRLAYAVQEALNKTAVRVEQAIQEHTLGEFTVRQRQFIRRQAAKIDKTSFASVRNGRAYVEIAVGQAPRLFLSEFEAGGERLPFVGKNVAMPVIGGPARPSISSKVPAQWTFEALQFRETTTRSGRRAIVSRTQSAFIVPGVGVFQRVGGETKLVYAFVPSVRLAPRLEFEATAQSVADRWFHDDLQS